MKIQILIITLSILEQVTEPAEDPVKVVANGDTITVLSGVRYILSRMSQPPGLPKAFSVKHLK